MNLIQIVVNVAGVPVVIRKPQSQTPVSLVRFTYHVIHVNMHKTYFKL